MSKGLCEEETIATPSIKVFLPYILYHQKATRMELDLFLLCLFTALRLPRDRQ